ncbi:phage capsid family protein [Desulfosporosinus acididurans]|uniref:Phage capsid family protein n=1 Tax=Desulfosporosinus acididurans TaxID=476652 RepID=A0A0J1FKN1_9FIRM|nr:phage major capsid protein [Desulfosporosinus acididurans]KLU64025.1 phage capsid family protein [Desulfosporosinus acididurans]
MTITEKKQKRATIVTQARSILDKAEQESRDLTTEEENSYNAAMTDVEKLSKEIEREERQQSLERGLGKVEDTDPNKVTDPEGRAAEEKKKEIRASFVGGLRTGNFSEYRDLQMTNATQAGYLVAPEQLVAQLIKDLDNYFFIRQYARKFTIKGTHSLGFPKRTQRASRAVRGSELAAPIPDKQLAFGKREFRPKWLTAEILVSKPLLQNSVIDPEEIVREELAYAFGQTQEQEFMTGDGAEEALGLFTPSDLGISTARDVTGLLNFDTLIEAKFSIKQQYWKNMKWIYHRDAIKQLAKIKDGDGQYIWRQSVMNSEPDLLLGVPFLMSEYAPDSFSSGDYAGIIGDLSQYWIVDSMDMEIQALFELYARTNQVDFIARSANDGMPVLEESFARIKLQ